LDGGELAHVRQCISLASEGSGQKGDQTPSSEDRAETREENYKQETREEICPEKISGGSEKR
jgi:hypothetical protein